MEPIVRPQARPVLLGALAMTGEEASRALARSGQAAVDPAAMLRLRDPAQLRISQDDRMALVHHDDFVPVMDAVLADPIGTEHFTVRIMLGDALLGNDLIADAQVEAS